MKNIKIAMFVLGIGFLLMVSGISLALYRYNIDGTNKELITGDIWMKYTGSNQLVINDMLPSDGIKVLKTDGIYEYVYNENMTSDEMNSCIEYFGDWWYEEGETVEAYCAGTGTSYGDNIRDVLDNYYWFRDDLLNLKIFVKNAIVPSRKVIYTSLEVNTNVTEEEINSCMQMDFYREIDEGSTKETYCRGTGTIEGKTISQLLDESNKLEDYTEYDEHWVDMNEKVTPLLNSNVVKAVVDMPYFEFTIDGKNTYAKKDIIYDIVLSYGDNHETRTTRIKDENLQFTLIEVDEDGNFVDVLLNKQKYFDLSNKRIWVERIPANSNAEVNKKYRLYMYIASDTVIGNIEQDYTLDEWADVYASIKVGVNGDFNEKELETTDESCFTGYIQKIYTYNENMTEDEINACIDYFQYYYFAEDETEEAYCRGTGTRDGTTIREDFNNYIGGSYWESHETLITNNILVFVDYGDYVITDYDENCGGYVNFPETIEGYKLTEIELDAFYDKGIIDVTFSSNIKHISTASFMSNNLTDVFIPSNVTQFACDAFDYDVNITYENENLVCVEEGGNA